MLGGVTSVSFLKSIRTCRSFCNTGFCAKVVSEATSKRRIVLIFVGSFRIYRLHKLQRFTHSNGGAIICRMITLLMILFTLTGGVADEWSQFRGPNGTGVSNTTGLPAEFGPQKNVIWKAALPPGHSSPVLTRDRIFVTAHDKDKLFVICLDRQSGKILWQREAPRLHAGRLQNVNGPASPSPVTDGSNVYVFFQDFGLISYDSAGRERWKHP